MAGQVGVQLALIESERGRLTLRHRLLNFGNFLFGARRGFRRGNNPRRLSLMQEKNQGYQGSQISGPTQQTECPAQNAHLAIPEGRQGLEYFRQFGKCLGHVRVVQSAFYYLDACAQYLVSTLVPGKGRGNSFAPEGGQFGTCASIWCVGY